MPPSAWFYLASPYQPTTVISIAVCRTYRLTFPSPRVPCLTSSTMDGVRRCCRFTYPVGKHALLGSSVRPMCSFFPLPFIVLPSPPGKRWREHECDCCPAGPERGGQKPVFFSEPGVTMHVCVLLCMQVGPRDFGPLHPPPLLAKCFEFACLQSCSCP